MVEKPVPLTREGLAKLERELEYLRTVRRHEVAQRIHQAKELASTQNNAEYDDAKNEQAFVEGRILEIDQMLRSARVIDEGGPPGDAVEAGTTVRLRDLANGSELRYTIVGSLEADPPRDLISNESPVGRALIGRKKGETVLVRVPAGELRYEILEIVQ